MFDSITDDKEKKELFKHVHKYMQSWWTQENEKIPEVKETIQFASQRALRERIPISSQFFSTDSKEQWEKNLEERRGDLEEYGWLKPENEIVYNFNSNGFRDEEFTDYDDCWIAIGECFTFGTGLHRELTWPHLLEQKMQTKIWNLGQCTTGFDFTFRVILGLVDVLKPSKILVLEPVPITREVYEDSGPVWPGSWSSEYWMKSMSENKVERYVSRIKNYYALENFLQTKGIDFCFVPSEERHQIAMDSWMEVNKGEYAAARDLMHPGWHFHQRIFERWLKELDKGQK